MKRIYLFSLLALITVSGFSQMKNFIDQPYLETSARVDTLVTPDRIYLSILITEKDTKGKISVEELENKMADKLKQLNINLDKQLTLSDLSSNFKKYFLKQQDVLKSKAYSLLVYDALTAGKVIAALEEIDISNVNLEKTEYFKIEELQLNLKSKAVQKARSNAMAMVKPLNQKIGNAIYITDFGSPYLMQGQLAGVTMRGASLKNREEYKPIDIEFEKIKVESEVKVTFKLE
jgi:uncharacterized protein